MHMKPQGYYFGVVHTGVRGVQLLASSGHVPYYFQAKKKREHLHTTITTLLLPTYYLQPSPIGWAAKCNNPRRGKKKRTNDLATTSIGVRRTTNALRSFDNLSLHNSSTYLESWTNPPPLRNARLRYQVDFRLRLCTNSF